MARYITAQTKDNFQCMVISLKEEFYCHADAVIGIYCEVSIVVHCLSSSVYKTEIPSHQKVTPTFLPCTLYIYNHVQLRMYTYVTGSVET